LSSDFQIHLVGFVAPHQDSPETHISLTPERKKEASQLVHSRCTLASTFNGGILILAPGLHLPHTTFWLAARAPSKSTNGMTGKPDLHPNQQQLPAAVLPLQLSLCPGEEMKEKHPAWSGNPLGRASAPAQACQTAAKALLVMPASRGPSQHMPSRQSVMQS